MATATPTTDHDEIRRWAEERGGRPARVKATGGGNDPGILRIDFPGFSGEETLEEISWDEWAEWFDRNKLAILLADEKGNRFSKIVSRRTARAAGKRPAAKKRAPAKKASSKKAASKKAGGKKAPGKKAAAKKRPAAKKVASKKTSAKKRSSSKKTARRR